MTGNVCFHVMVPFLGNNSYCRRADALKMKMCTILYVLQNNSLSVQLFANLSVHTYIQIHLESILRKNLGTVLARLTIRWTVKMKPIIHIANIFSFFFVFTIRLVILHEFVTSLWYWTLILKFDVHIKILFFSFFLMKNLLNRINIRQSSHCMRK